MPMVYQDLHQMTRMDVFPIEQLDKTGTYTRKVKFFGYKGSLSKDEGEFEFLELTLFSDNIEGIEVKFLNCKK